MLKSKDEIIDFIKRRIDSEYRKHHLDLDWSMIAAIKIYSELRYIKLIKDEKKG